MDLSSVSTDPLKCHNNGRWTETLPIVLLGLRSALKEDLGGTCAEMLYGATLRLPADFFEPSKVSPGTDAASFLQRLCEVMQKLSPAPSSPHTKPAYFVHPSLETCTHVFVRNDAVKPPLTRPYDGPFRVEERSTKHFTVRIKGKDRVISVDRLKPAFINPDDTPPTADDRTLHLPTVPPDSCTPAPDTPTALPETTTRSGRKVRFNRRYL